MTRVIGDRYELAEQIGEGGTARVFRAVDTRLGRTVAVKLLNAGLAVAIPSLFGYNYILSRVKDAKDDMHIFIDEFVTKMAEFYKERND